MNHCLCLALPSFPFSLDLHACPQQLINQTRLGPSFARSCSISSDKDYPGISVLAQANGQVIELHDLSAGHVLCKEQLENKEPRQKQVLEYEGGSGTEGLKVAWKLCVLVASGAFPHSSSATALTQGFLLLRADSTSALKNRSYWWHSHVHLSLMCAKVHSLSGNLYPIHRLWLSKGVLTHSKESPEHPTVTMPGNCLCPFQE